jgi:hypothetical protein
MRACSRCAAVFVSVAQAHSADRIGDEPIDRTTADHAAKVALAAARAGALRSDPA